MAPADADDRRVIVVAREVLDDRRLQRRGVLPVPVVLIASYFYEERRRLHVRAVMRRLEADAELRQIAFRLDRTQSVAHEDRRGRDQGLRPAAEPAVLVIAYRMDGQRRGAAR
ncbi:hypothetical protein AUQ37_05820 [Candidatus Methanomethylophilus sp. 1R26]|nr:hypothetical protein AUQ37_05820 [Candidatus Methanomethylophilus sp. 1R26]